MFSLNIIKINKKGFTPTPKCHRHKSLMRGFTLLEVMVAVAIFALLMVASASIFANSFKAYQNARAIQRDLENAQYTMNLMAKTIRTSSVISPSGNFDYINIYDYSQDKCIKYEKSGNKIITGSSTPSTPGDKSKCSFSASNELSNVSVENMNFSVTKSSKPLDTPTAIVGKITISMKICATSGCTGSVKDVVQIQTTVSLRDYGEAGL